MIRPKAEQQTLQQKFCTVFFVLSIVFMSTSQKEEDSKRKDETDEQRSNRYQHIKFSLLPLCFVFVNQLIIGLSTGLDAVFFSVNELHP